MGKNNLKANLNKIEWLLTQNLPDSKTALSLIFNGSVLPHNKADSQSEDPLGLSLLLIEQMAIAPRMAFAVLSGIPIVALSIIGYVIISKLL